jgi:hypothetical protein
MPLIFYSSIKRASKNYIFENIKRNSFGVKVYIYNTWNGNSYVQFIPEFKE